MRRKRRRLELRISKNRRAEEGEMSIANVPVNSSRANQFKTTALCAGSGFLVVTGRIVYFHTFEDGRENDCI